MAEEIAAHCGKYGSCIVNSNNDCIVTDFNFITAHEDTASLVIGAFCIPVPVSKGSLKADKNNVLPRLSRVVGNILYFYIGKVTAAVLSGDVDVGFCGSEATIYVYNSGEEDYLINFARLTKRDGSFLVSRKKIDNFKLEDLKGKTVIGGRKGGMPEMTFEWALKQNGIDPKKDLMIDTSVAFPAMEGAFIGGDADFVTLFEPNATSVEKQGLGYVVGYVGTWGGEVPYTSYNAKKSFIDKNPKVIEGFTKAIDKGLKYVKETDSSIVAKDIYEFFPELSLNDLTAIIERYKTSDAWADSTNINKEDFNHLQEIMISAGELDKKAPYDKLIYQGK